MFTFSCEGSPSDLEWAHSKETMQSSYPTEIRKLEVLSGVRKEMEERQQFFVTLKTIRLEGYFYSEMLRTNSKIQHEGHFTWCRFRKYRKRADWIISRWGIEQRTRQRRE